LYNVQLALPGKPLGEWLRVEMPQWNLQDCGTLASDAAASGESLSTAGPDKDK
jgi:hypothetical protein